MQIVKNLFSRSHKKIDREQRLFHVTHAKAGSTWIYRILKKTFRDRIEQRVGDKIQIIEPKPGAVYGAIFSSIEDLSTIDAFKNQPHFFVMRDIRDTLVSLYFSHRYSHVPSPKVLSARKRLETMSEVDGMLYYFQESQHTIKRIQRSWLESNSPVYKYEDLFMSQGETIPDILDDLGIDYSADSLKKAIRSSSFERSFNRKPGENDIHSHGRNGLPGNWREHQTDQLNQFIDEHLSDHIRFSGYEL